MNMQFDNPKSSLFSSQNSFSPSMSVKDLMSRF